MQPQELTRGGFWPERPSDLKMYLGLCERGQLYEFLIRESGWSKGREAWKTMVWFRFLYGAGVGPNWKPGPRYLEERRKQGYSEEEIAEGVLGLKELARVFKKRFPTVTKWMSDKKRGDRGGLAKAMQRVESKLVIGGVVGTLARERPEVPFATIHDSLLVLPEHVELVVNLLKGEYKRQGVSPSLSVSSPERELAAA